MSYLDHFPEHEHNETLIKWAAPRDWRNPTPTERYNLVIIGGGSAGLVAASGAAQLGAKVALIEKHALGGDCLNVGCVPSKALIRAAKTVGMIRKSAKLGVTAGEVKVDFKKVMEHVWQSRAAIAPHDSAERYTKLGVDVYFGTAEFTGTHTIAVDGQTLEFKKALIATGSRPLVIPIPGLADAGYITNETVWNLTELPESLAVIGGGPIGAELAQSFQRLGTQVTMLDIAPQILIREDPDAAAIVQKSLVSDGVKLAVGANTKNVELRDGKKALTVEIDGETSEIVVDEILLAVGRIPNLDGLGLDLAGVEYHKRGLTVNDNLQTTNPDIYGAGDVASKYQFTHVAGHSAAIVIQNALFSDFIPLAPKRRMSDLIIPWATYTDPEVAHVGLYERDAAEQGIEIDVYKANMAENDRAIADADLEGFVKIITKKGSDKILGATIVGSNASEMISEITVAMKNGLGLGKITGVIHPYPTKAETIFKAAGEYSKSRLSPTIANLTNRWMRFTR